MRVEGYFQMGNRHRFHQQTIRRIGGHHGLGTTPNAFTLPVSDSVMGYILAFARNAALDG
jgi:hypothetical protein